MSVSLTDRPTRGTHPLDDGADKAAGVGLSYTWCDDGRSGSRSPRTCGVKPCVSGLARVASG